MTYSLATIRLNARAIPVLRGQLSFLGLFDMPPLIPRHADTAAAHNSDNASLGRMRRRHAVAGVIKQQSGQ
jgi:hypothetical protein